MNFGIGLERLIERLPRLLGFFCANWIIPSSYHAVAYLGYSSTAFSRLFCASSGFFFLIASRPFS